MVAKQRADPRGVAGLVANGLVDQRPRNETAQADEAPRAPLKALELGEALRVLGDPVQRP